MDELNARFSKRILHREDIDENVLLIRINQLYHYGMSDIELYDATRSAWVINQERAEKLQYAFAVYEGMVMEVYKITAWLPAYSTMNTRNISEEILKKDIEDKRKEVVGVVAPPEIREKCIGAIVSDLFVKGNANPIMYLTT